MSEIAEYELFANQCTQWETDEGLTIDMYSVMNRCVTDGDVIALPVLCDQSSATSTPISTTTVIV